MNLLEWPKSKTVTTPNASEDMKQQELSFIADECAKFTATLVDRVVVSYNTKCILTIGSTNRDPWYLHK